MRFEDESWTWPEATAAAQRARAAAGRAPPRNGPLHVGVLADNIPEYVHWLGAAGWPAPRSWASTHPTAPSWPGTSPHRVPGARRGPSTATCLDGLDLGEASAPTGVAPRRPRLPRPPGAHEGATLADVDAALVAEGRTVGPDDLYLLLFTSGTSGAQGGEGSQAASPASAGIVAMGFGLGGRRLLPSMPLFHSNALMAGWCLALAGGATRCCGGSSRRRPSSTTSAATGHLRQLRGQAARLHPGLRRAARRRRQPTADRVRQRGRRGRHRRVRPALRLRGHRRVRSSEGGPTSAAPLTPRPVRSAPPARQRGARPRDRRGVPARRFDDHGALTNADEAIGELVSRQGGTQFGATGATRRPRPSVARGDTYWTATSPTKRRRRLPLLRRPLQRLAAGRRREPRRPPSSASCCATPTWPRPPSTASPTRWSATSAWPRLVPAPRRRLRPRRLRRLPRRAGRPVDQGGARVVRVSEALHDADQQGAQRELQKQATATDDPSGTARRDLAYEPLHPPERREPDLTLVATMAAVAARTSSAVLASAVPPAGAGDGPKNEGGAPDVGARRVSGRGGRRCGGRRRRGRAAPTPQRPPRGISTWWTRLQVASIHERAGG